MKSDDQVVFEGGWTPGPWSVFNSGEWPGIDDGDGKVTIVRYGLDGADDGGIRGRGPRESMANASLIAAAPDLYEALKEATAFYEHMEGSDNPVAEKFRAALSKARGQ